MTSISKWVASKRYRHVSLVPLYRLRALFCVRWTWGCLGSDLCVLLTNLLSNSARFCLNHARPENGYGKPQNVVDDRYGLYCIDFDTSYVQNGLVVAEIERFVFLLAFLPSKSARSCLSRVRPEMTLASSKMLSTIVIGSILSILMPHTSETVSWLQRYMLLGERGVPSVLYPCRMAQI